MITDKDRSYYIGASDTDKVVGPWTSKTWRLWWLQKLGKNKHQFENRFMKAGNCYEHRILLALHIPGMRLDEQVIHENLRLRVNYDGCTENCIYECKTFKFENGFRLTPKIIHQVQVQMFAKGIRNAKVVAYGLSPEDYENMERPVDPQRIQIFTVHYDENWINTEYLPNLRVLAWHLKNGTTPPARYK